VVDPWLFILIDRGAACKAAKVKRGAAKVERGAAKVERGYGPRAGAQAFWSCRHLLHRRGGRSLPNRKVDPRWRRPLHGLPETCYTCRALLLTIQ